MADGGTAPDEILRSIMGEPLVLSPGAPLESARELVRCKYMNGPVRTIHHQADGFYVWTGTYYAEVSKEEVRAATYQFLDSACRTTERDKLAPFNPNRPKVANVLEALAAETQLPLTTRAPAWLDDEPHPLAGEIMSCENGLLHLPTRRLEPHSPTFFTLNAVGYPCDLTAGEPTAWLQFLRALWPADEEAISVLQELFGLLLTGDTRHQKAFLIVGPKRSGKGTIARVLTALLGPDNVAGPTLSGLGQNFGLAPLIGKQLAIVSDARLSSRVDQHVIVERLLAITGEDTLTIDRKYQGAWTGRLPTRFLILTNELPRLADASGAFASRFIVLTLQTSFYGREDHGLTDRLHRELPGILNWAMEGRDRLVARGYFIQPASSLQAIEELEDLGSPIGAFLRARCIVERGRCVECGRLFGAWKLWCEEQGREHVGTVQGFGRDLRAAVPGLSVVQPRAEDGSRDRYYQGLDIDLDQARQG
jgi:putative DNA primase/helicase